MATENPLAGSAVPGRVVVDVRENKEALLFYLQFYRHYSQDRSQCSSGRTMDDRGNSGHCLSVDPS